MTSFTPVHHEADWVWPGQTRAWQRPFFPLREAHGLHQGVFWVYEGEAMPSNEPEDSRIVSVRLPHTLVQRLDRL
jgi:hypothetical protein